MSLTNQTKVTPSISNELKISVGETWSSIITTWATETRTWLAVSQLIGNVTKISSSITNQSRP